MFDIALTVASCLRVGTRADVAWLVELEGLTVGDWSDAVVFTPGGGKAGALLSGAFDGQIADVAGRITEARIVDCRLSEVDALISGVPAGGRARVVVAPAEALPAEVWPIATARERFCLVADIYDEVVADIRLATPEVMEEFGEEVLRAVDGPAGSTVVGSLLVSVFAAIPQMVVVGSGPVTDALVDLCAVVGWQAEAVMRQDQVAGVIARLGRRDMVVVAAHDLELAGAGLAAALDGDSGYIASVGSRKMQADRGDWLAFRGDTDLTRVHGPAGLDIGASTPGEIAVSIVAEAIASLDQS